MKNKIFLSYSYNDRSWVEQFSIALEKEGIDVCSSFHDLKSGEDIQEKVESELRESETLVVLLSSSSILSQWMFFEFGAAVADNKRIISLVIDDIRQEQIPFPMMKYQCLRESSPVLAAKEVAIAVQN